MILPALITALIYKVAHREDGSRFESALVVLIGISVVWGSTAGFAIFWNRSANADLK